MKPWRNNSKSAKVTFNPEEIMRRADALFRDERSKDLQGVIAEKLEQLQSYDVLAMDRVVAILSWGRSGSLLLASYLDGHEDVMLLPAISGWKLYEFYERYSSLSLRDKLIAYPAYEQHLSRFFDGDFPISSTQYYAAVQAILEFYRDWATEFLESRRAFVLFMHIAYNLVLGRPASSQPLIVYALHESDGVRARQLVEDFPHTKFVHTVRDPISTCDAMFQFAFGTLFKDAPRAYTLAPYGALICMTNQDRPHVGMEPRTRTIRFEDLHSDAAQTIGDLSDWLGLSFQPALLNSTFNGNPYVVKREGVAWSGPRREQVQRRSLYLSLKDRVLLYALFYENCVDWNYPCPKNVGNPIVRFIVFVSLILVPMRMELIAARGVFMGWTLPLVRRGKIWPAIKSLLGIGFYRVKIIGLLVPAFFRRLAYKTTLLQIDNKKRALEHPDVDAFAKGSETPCGRS